MFWTSTRSVFLLRICYYNCGASTRPMWQWINRFAIIMRQLKLWIASNLQVIKIIGYLHYLNDLRCWLCCNCWTSTRSVFMFVYGGTTNMGPLQGPWRLRIPQIVAILCPTQCSDYKAIANLLHHRILLAALGDIKHLVY